MIVLAHSKLEWPKNFNQELSLDIYSLIGFEYLLKSSRKL